MTQPTALMIGSAAMAKMIAELPRVAEPNSLASELTRAKQIARLLRTNPNMGTAPTVRFYAEIARILLLRSETLVVCRPGLRSFNHIAAREAPVGRLKLETEVCRDG